MLVFRSEAHIDRWSAARGLPRGGTLSLDQAWRLARAWYATKAVPEWRRPSVDEAEALFASLGIAGPFWALR